MLFRKMKLVAVVLFAGLVVGVITKGNVLVVGLELLISCISFIMIMRNLGSKKYGLRFFTSIQFFLTFSGSIFLIEMSQQGKTGNATGEIMAVSLSYLGAYYLNIKQCNALFGIFYTLAQIMGMILIWCFVAIGAFCLVFQPPHLENLFSQLVAQGSRSGQR